MEGNELIRYMLEELGMSVKGLSDKTGINYQTLRNKLHKNNFSFNEIRQITDALGFDIQATKRE